MTLREAPKQADWNSHTAEWQKLIDHYRGTNLVFVVLRDHFAVSEEPVLTGDNVVECPEAVLDIVFRAALYEACGLNLFVCSGPCWLCFLNPRSNYLVFNMPADPAAARTRLLADHEGLEPGHDMALAGPFQRLIWEPDDFPTMRTELDRMLSDMGVSAGPGSSSPGPADQE